MITPDKIRNVAIVAHIDHGKTTLIDAIFRATRTFRDNARVQERVMDSGELERERGITIRAKHCTVFWQDYQINIIDTPGHADFSGEVERVLSMVDSVLLLVDAAEGPMPQTRYVLLRALRMGFRPLVIINKADRPNANPQDALNRTFDLFLDLGANEHQADFSVLYGSALQGWMVRHMEKDPREGLDPLFETIVERVPPPQVDPQAPFRMQVSTLAWSDYIGRIGCGKILSGKISLGDPFSRIATHWTDEGHTIWEVTSTRTEKVAHLWATRGLDRTAVDEAQAGDIVWIAGPQEIGIGDTFAAPDFPQAALVPLEIEEPTVSMFFLVNTGPLAGQEGKAVTLRQVRDRLERELKSNVSLRMEDLGRADGVKVSGRGELHLAILIEEMRREGMEFCVSRPEVITKRDAEGNLTEPIEQLIVDVPEEYQGVVIEKLSRRKGELVGVFPTGPSTVRLEFTIPTRGLIGYRSDFLTDTRGLGILSARMIGYDLWRGEVSGRIAGSIVSMDTGDATAYQLDNLQSRGTLFIGPLERVYEGMVVGENSRPSDIPCNPTKKKHLSNMRSATKDSTVVLKVPRRLTLEAALEWIADDELVEITPQSIRVRKGILNAEARKKAERRKDAEGM